MDETLFLTVNIIDRFLEKEVVPRNKLQLVGVTAMLLACKYEEVSVPVVEDLVVISDRAYTKGQVLEMVISLNTVCTPIKFTRSRILFLGYRYNIPSWMKFPMYFLLYCC
jgi:hypothetical protein